MKFPIPPTGGGLGRQETDHTSPVTWIVDTAVRAAMSQTLIVLSADLRRVVNLRQEYDDFPYEMQLSDGENVVRTQITLVAHQGKSPR